MHAQARVMHAIVRRAAKYATKGQPASRLDGTGQTGSANKTYQFTHTLIFSRVPSG